MATDLVLLVAVAAVLAMVGRRAVCMVPPGTIRVARRLGRFHRVLEPGMHVLLPIVESSSAPVAVGPALTQLPAQVVTTRDQQRVSLELSLALLSLDPRADAALVVEPDADATRVVRRAVGEVLGSASLDELALTRSTLVLVLRAVVDEALAARQLRVACLSVAAIEPQATPPLG